ncbi:MULTISPECIES: flavodoxin domain-containing protein [unclassified Modestobacter]
MLVAVASRHGATVEIAEELARALQAAAPALVVRTLPVERAGDPAEADAVVLGSAVYAGRWLAPARDYAARHAAALRGRPVWLFSSGPIGAPPFPPDDPHDAAPLLRSLTAREHRVFPGRLDPTRLGLAERALVTAMRAPVGDSRDWPAVRAWAGEIAAELTAVAVRGDG